MFRVTIRKFLHYTYCVRVRIFVPLSEFVNRNNHKSTKPHKNITNNIHHEDVNRNNDAGTMEQLP